MNASVNRVRNEARSSSESSAWNTPRESSATLYSGVAVALGEYLNARGQDGTAVLQAAGLKLETLSERYSRFPIRQLATAFEISAQQTNDSLFGLHFGEWYTPSILTAGHYAFSNAPNLREALNAVKDYRSRVVGIPTQLTDQGAFMEITWNIELADLSPRHVIDLFATRTLKHIHQTTGPDWLPLKVALESGKPENVSEHYRLFGPNVHFDQPLNSFWIDSGALTMTILDADPDLYYMAQNSIRNPFPYKQVDKGPVERLRRFISERLDKTDITLAAAAKIMGMTPQQLRRTLKKRGTSFQCVLDDTRKAHAVHYLCKTETRFSEIAYLLGFSDQSCLTRATKRWFGVTPKDLRHNAR